VGYLCLVGAAYAAGDYASAIRTTRYGSHPRLSTGSTGKNRVSRRIATFYLNAPVGEPFLFALSWLALLRQTLEKTGKHGDAVAGL